MVLQREGVIGILKKMSRNPEENPTIADIARATFKEIFRDGDSAFRLGLRNAKPFVFNYDEIHRIDKELVGKCLERIQKTLNKKYIKVQINWRAIERMEEKERNNAISMIAREAVWDELATAVELLSYDEQIVHAFLSQVKLIFVCVGNENQLEVKSLVMKYSIDKDGDLWTPKTIAGKISKCLLGRDITESTEEVDEAYELAVQELKKVTKDSRIYTLGDINILAFHLELAERLWKSVIISKIFILIFLFSHLQINKQL